MQKSKIEKMIICYICPAGKLENANRSPPTGNVNSFVKLMENMVFTLNYIIVTCLLLRAYSATMAIVSTPSDVVKKYPEK